MPTKRMNASVSVLCLICGAVWFSNAAALAFQPPNTQAPNTQPPNTQPPAVTVVTIDPNQLVLKAIHQAVHGPPFLCKVHQSSQAYDQVVVVSGDYKASGGGSGQFRYTSRVSSGETTIDTIQVSDGRLMYTQVGAKDAPRCVNIDQVRESLGGNSIDQLRDSPEVSIYLAIGGHAELLRNLYHRYRWYKAVEGRIDGVDVWQLVGTLRTEPPRISGNALVDKQALTPPAANPNLPAEVRLTLGRSIATAYFPFRVEYFSRSKTPDNTQTVHKLVSKLVHSEPSPTTILEKDFAYKVPDSADKIDYETNQYMPETPLARKLPVPLK